MEITFFTRLKHSWNAFMNCDPTYYDHIDMGVGSSVRPDRPKLTRGNERTIVTSIYNRIAMDVSSININHCRVDDNGRFISVIDSPLNTCLNLEANLDQTGRAFIHQDADSARAIMEGDSEIDREQKKIESLCFNLLMQQQPVARDLRTISAAMKMVTDMERIGDHAADISEMTILMSSDKPYRVNIEHVKSMASETMLMLIRAIEAYVEKNNDKALVVMKQDDVVDELFDKVKAELIDFIREHPEDGEQAEDLLMVAKYFERIGDHATNIAEWVEFALDDKVRKS